MKIPDFKNLPTIEELEQKELKMNKTFRILMLIAYATGVLVVILGETIILLRGIAIIPNSFILLALSSWFMFLFIKTYQLKK